MEGSVVSGEKVRKENNFMRGVREEREMGDFLTGYRKSKISFYNNMAKEYYKDEFSRDKIKLREVRGVKERLNESEIVKRKNIETIKDYRIKTSLGFRPFVRNANAMAKTVASNFYGGKENSKERGDFSKSFDEVNTMEASNIDGLGLMSNPFELRIRKKKH